MEIITMVILGLVFIAILLAFKWYRVVPPSEAHLVVTPSKIMVVSPDPEIQRNAKAQYFAIPNIPFFGRKIRIMGVTIKEIAGEMETYEKDQARYLVTYSVKYRVTDVKKASETFVTTEDLEKQADDQIRSAVRATTVRYSVIEARANKQKMAEEIRTEIQEDFANWGLSLVMFSLVDFQDTNSSKIISNLSLRREVEIESDTRQQNAEKYKNARTKEAEAEQLARNREIEKEQKIAEREQEKLMKVAEQQKLTRIKELDVTQVNMIKMQEIEREKAKILANQNKEVEEINKTRKLLEGQGDRIMNEEKAKGNAASIRENGFAQAEAKEKLQSALNKFKPEAIQALVAEKVVDMQQAVGIETAKAIGNSDTKVFIGSDNGGGFDIGKVITATQVSNNGLANSVMNKIARPNDLGLSELDIGKVLPKKNK